MKKNQLKQLIKEVIRTMMVEQYQTTIKDPITGQDLDIDVEYDYTPGHTGTRSGMDRFAEPDDGSQVEIQSITTEDGREIDPRELSDDTIESLEMDILRRHEGLDEEKEKPDYGVQLQMAWRKAKKEGNVEAMAYYSTLGNTSANVPFEQFKGSWAYNEWLKKPETIEAIQREKDEMKRWSYMRENCNRR